MRNLFIILENARFFAALRMTRRLFNRAKGCENPIPIRLAWIGRIYLKSVCNLSPPSGFIPEISSKTLFAAVKYLVRSKSHSSGRPRSAKGFAGGERPSRSPEIRLRIRVVRIFVPGCGIAYSLVGEEQDVCVGST